MKKIIIGSIIVVVCFLLVFFLFIQPMKTFKEEKKLGESALKEKNYEQAILHFEKALEIKEDEDLEKALKKAKKERTTSYINLIKQYTNLLKEKKFEKSWELLSKNNQKKLKKEEYVSYLLLLDLLYPTKEYGISKGEKEDTFRVLILTKEAKNVVFEEIKLQYEKKQYRLSNVLSTDFKQKLSKAYTEYGKTFTTQKKRDDMTAINMYLVALEYDPKNIETLFLLAISYEKTGEKELAITYLNEAIKFAKEKKAKESVIKQLTDTLNKIKTGQ